VQGAVEEAGRVFLVIPAWAGIRVVFFRQKGGESKNGGALRQRVHFWIPAFAGRTGFLI
jgi:hypothetical protein